MSTSNMNFAAGLEKFGTLGGLNWDEEFEELASTAPVVDMNQDATTQDNVELDRCMSTKPTESEHFPFEGDSDDVDPTEDPVDVQATRPESPNAEVLDLWEEMPQSSVNISFEDLAAVSEPEQHDTASTSSESLHPGFTEETPSWYGFTATSPQVARWAVSPGIFEDSKWTLDMCKDDHIVHRDIPRIASCLLRAVQHIYPVPDNARVSYPRKAKGQKVSLPRFPRGSMGLKELDDEDVPEDTYIPNGIRIRQPGPEGRAFYPRPSLLSNVATIDCEKDVSTPQPTQATGPLEHIRPSKTIRFEAILDDQNSQPVKSCHHATGNLSPANWNSAPSSLFMSGENYLEDESEEMEMEMEEARKTNPTIIPASDDDEEISIQVYDFGSEYDADEGLEFSFEKNIEAQFEVEIDGGCLPSDVVDEDDEHFYSSSEKSSPWPSSPPIPLLELDSSATVSEHDVDNLPELTSAPYSKIPGLDYAYRLDATLFPPADHASGFLDYPDSKGTTEDADEDSLELPEIDDLATALNGDEVDRAISCLESMGPASLIDLGERKLETDGIVPQVSFKDPRDLPEITTGGAGGIVGVIGAIGHTIWSICSVNPFSVFLF